MQDGKGWLSLALILIGFIIMVFDLVGADLVMNMVLILMVRHTSTLKIVSQLRAALG